MSEKLFRFLLAELTTVRIRCRHKGCGAVTELAVSALWLVRGRLGMLRD